MEKIRYSDEFICPKCGSHTALFYRIDGTYQAHCMICDVYYDFEIAKTTNADRIRAMSDEELAEWFIKIQDDVADYYDSGHAYAPELPTMKDSWLDWLRKEANE